MTKVLLFLLSKELIPLIILQILGTSKVFFFIILFQEAFLGSCLFTCIHKLFIFTIQCFCKYVLSTVPVYSCTLFNIDNVFAASGAKTLFIIKPINNTEILILVKVNDAKELHMTGISRVLVVIATEQWNNAHLLYLMLLDA